MKRPLLIAALAPLLLAGCADIVAPRARPVVERALSDAEWGICQAAPIGLVRQRYGRTREGALAYQAFCGIIADDVSLLTAGRAAALPRRLIAA